MVASHVFWVMTLFALQNVQAYSITELDKAKMICLLDFHEINGPSSYNNQY